MRRRPRLSVPLVFCAAVAGALAGCGDAPTEPEEEPTPDLPFTLAVHMRDDEGITVLRSDGTVEARIRCPQCLPETMKDPRWSRDGRMLSVTARRDTFSVLLVVNRDGTGLREIASVPRIWPAPGSRIGFSYPGFQADWSADGKLVYTRSTSTETSLETVNADGTSRSVIYRDAIGLGDPGSYRVIVPRWGGADGTITVGMDRRVFAMNSDGSNLRPLAPGIASASSHTWSPDGRSIAFIADGDEQNDLMSLDVASGAIRTVYKSANQRRVGTYCWSPDGARYSLLVGAFPSALLTVNADGSGAREEATVAASFYPKAAWSPDGRYLIFLADMGIPGGGLGMQLYGVRLRDRAVAPITSLANLWNYSLAVAEGDHCSY